MRSNLVRRRVAVLIALAVAAPTLYGCATLGIATTEELTATETRLQNANNASTTRLDLLEKDQNEMNQTLSQMTASVDTLNARFARASEWLQNMNLDTIAEDAQTASNAATVSEQRTRAFLEHYLEWLRAQNELLMQQIQLLESKLQSMTMDEPAGEKTDAPSESGGEGTDSGGG